MPLHTYHVSAKVAFQYTEQAENEQEVRDYLDDYTAHLRAFFSTQDVDVEAHITLDEPHDKVCGVCGHSNGECNPEVHYAEARY